jgi:hypothetical protein
MSYSYKPARGASSTSSSRGNNTSSSTSSGNKFSGLTDTGYKPRGGRGGRGQGNSNSSRANLPRQSNVAFTRGDASPVPSPVPSPFAYVSSGRVTDPTLAALVRTNTQNAIDHNRVLSQPATEFNEARPRAYYGNKPPPMPETNPVDPKFKSLDYDTRSAMFWPTSDGLGVDGYNIKRLYANGPRAEGWFADQHGTKRHYHKGRLHNDNDEPSEVYASGTMVWYTKGYENRYNDKPSYVSADGRFEWLKMGVRHRDNDLAAIIYPDGSMMWLVDGKHCRKNKHLPCVVYRWPASQPQVDAVTGVPIWYREEYYDGSGVYRIKDGHRVMEVVDGIIYGPDLRAPPDLNMYSDSREYFLLVNQLPDDPPSTHTFDVTKQMSQMSITQ